MMDETIKIFIVKLSQQKYCFLPMVQSDRVLPKLYFKKHNETIETTGGKMMMLIQEKTLPSQFLIFAKTPIKIISTGEKMNAKEFFHLDRMNSEMGIRRYSFYNRKSQ